MHATVSSTSAVIRSMGLFNALSVLAMSYLPSWLGKIYLETTVDYEPGAPVRHTTTVFCWGLAMMKSEEYVHILDNGVEFTIVGESRFSMMPWRRVPMEGRGQIDPTARHATYALSWLGTTLEQTTDRQNDHVILRQSAPGFTAIQHLKRTLGKGD